MMKPSQQHKASAWDDGGGWEAEPDAVDDWNFDEIEKPHNSFSKGQPKQQIDQWGDIQEGKHRHHLYLSIV